MAYPSSSPPKIFAAASFGIFFLLGLLAPILGPTLPALSKQFLLSATAASLLLSLNALGAFLGVVLAGLLAARWRSPQRSLLALVIIAPSCLGLAFALSYEVALGASFLLGFGFGVLDFTINVWLATSFGSRSAAMLNLLSAGFGVGAVLSPLVVGLAGGNFRVPLLGCACLAVLLLPALLLTRRWDAGRAERPPNVDEAAGSRRVWVTLAGFVALFLAYVGVEAGIAAWEISHLQDALGLSTASASQLASLFWISFTVGRLLSAPLALRVAPPQLVIGTLVLAAASVALAVVPQAAPAAYALAGLFLAPVFNTGLVWLTRALPSQRATTWVFAGSFLGPALIAPLIGVSRDTFGPVAIPVTLAGTALLALAAALWLQRRLGSQKHLEPQKRFAD